VAARAVATPTTTLRRWSARDRAGEQLARQRGPRNRVPASAAAVAAGEERVRVVRGHIGCAALGKAVGLSRRTALRVKERTLIEMERERKAAAAQVRITTPGVVRGFDQMYVETFGGWRFALISADASVPYRTSAHVAEHYLSDDVVDALEHDIELNGAPLIVRFDRAAVHRTPDVSALLESCGVLVLHGPPHCPQYYGQLERQNREHRAWLDEVDLLGTPHLEAEIGEMFHCLNELIPRRSLGWCTSSQLWNQRPALDVDRDAFRDEVQERAARIAPSLGDRERRLGFDQRFAIEHTLKKYGYLEIKNEERC
jgi:transposase InsO family protein